MFMMGGNSGEEDETPVHEVHTSAFYIDEHEVTTEQYCKFLNSIRVKYDGKSCFDLSGKRLISIEYSKIGKSGGQFKPQSNCEKHPANAVSWYGAAAYAQWVVGRLPTEAEWEKAARGGLKSKKYPWGDEISRDYANYSKTEGKDRWGGAAPVKSFAPNRYKLYDMAGNVWEWCADEYDKVYYSKSPKNNPKGPSVLITFKNNDFVNIYAL